MSNLTLLGLGPVGLATAWSLLQRGHSVHGFDINPAISKQCQRGIFPRAAEFTQELRAAAESSRFFVHSTPAPTLWAETVIICVGTPADKHGFNLSGVCSALLAARSPKGSGLKRHYILRSTLAPGTIQREILPILQAGEEFDFTYYPEFLREKFLREDSLHPPLQVVAHSSENARKQFAALFTGQFHELRDFASVEALKIACNAFHAMKVVFANEMADLCEEAGGSAQEMMRAFCEDKKLNISSRYLKPGAPFGGPCLDKDLRALEHALDQHGIQGGLLRSIRKSNDRHLAEQEQSPEPEFNASRNDLSERGIGSAVKEYSLPAG